MFQWRQRSGADGATTLQPSCASSSAILSNEDPSLYRPWSKMTVAFVLLNGTRVTTTAGRVQCRDIRSKREVAGEAVGFEWGLHVISTK